jgi:hypothetical protein
MSLSSSYTQILKNIIMKSNIYRLNGDFSVIKQIRRNAIRKEKVVPSGTPA